MNNEKDMKTGTRIGLTGVYNTRDIGGYRALDGRVIRPKRLIRSGALGALTLDDIRILTQEYHLKTVIDFRTLEEVEENPDPNIEGVALYLNPILSGAQMGITREGENDAVSMVDMMITYGKQLGEHPEQFGAQIYPPLIREEFPRSQYRKFFEILLKQEEGAVLWHCTAGKDRAGTGTALLLSALNVDRDTIIHDYLLTNTFISVQTEEIIRMVSEKTADPQILNAVKVLNSVQEEYLLTVFDTIDEIYGSMETFLETQMGLTPDKLTKLQDMYLTTQHK